MHYQAAVSEYTSAGQTASARVATNLVAVASAGPTVWQRTDWRRGLTVVYLDVTDTNAIIGYDNHSGGYLIQCFEHATRSGSDALLQIGCVQGRPERFQ
jgi:hypothetical protein